MSFLTALIAFALFLFALMLLLRFVNSGPRLQNQRLSVAKYLDQGIVLALFLYGAVVLYSAITGRRAGFFILHGLLVGILTFASLVRKPSSSMVSSAALSMPLAIVFLSLYINGPMPITQDEGRLTGFAQRIIQDGGWSSGTYSENQYYQFFHVVPCIKAILSMITGLDMLCLVHPLAVLAATLLTSLNIYVISKRLTGKEEVAVLGPILFYLTPPISTLGFIPYLFATALCLTAFSVIFSGNPTTRTGFILVVLVSIVGIITHAIYSLMLLLTLVTLTQRPGEHRSGVPILKSIVRITLLLTLTYWAGALALDQFLNIGKRWTQSLAEIITGQVRPFERGRTPWYLWAPPELSCSWAFLPALAAAYVSGELISRLRDTSQTKVLIRNLRSDRLLCVGLTGMTMLGVAFITRASTPLYFRYLFPFYTLLVPASAMLFGKIVDKGRTLSILIAIIAIIVVSSYAVQDPMFSPDVHEVLMLSDRKTWVIARSLAGYTSTDVEYRIDPRVAIGFEALTIESIPELYAADRELHGQRFFLLGSDRLAEAWSSYYIDEEELEAIRKDDFNVVFSDGFYEAYYTEK